MRNLVVERDDACSIPLEAGKAATQFCCNSAEASGYVGTGFLDVLCISFSDSKVKWRVPLGASAGGPDSRITGMSHSLEMDALVVGLSTGELMLIHCDTQEVEEVGTIEGGVCGLSWSPDGEVLLLATGVGHLILMTQDWELQAEVALDAAPDALDTAAGRWWDVAVCWRGDGKYLASSHRVIKEGVEQRCVQIWDRQNLELHSTGEPAPGLLPLLAWQPNGRHLYTAHCPPAAPTSLPASSTVGTPNNPKGVRAAARAAAAAAAVPIASSKAAATAAAAATATSQSAATSQPTNNAALSCDDAAGGGGVGAGVGGGGGAAAPFPRVLLYERNGLQHGGFELRGGGEVASLSWSGDSEMLAVVQREAADWLVQVWHRSNWHWYLKVERRYPAAAADQQAGAGAGAAGGGAPLVAWDEQVAGRLHVLVGGDGSPGASGGATRHERLQLQWCTHVSDWGTAVVVDGTELLLTPLRHAVVPPPMCAARASLPAPATALAVGSSGAGGVQAGAAEEVDDERLAVMMSDGRLALLRCVEEDLWEETAEEQQEALEIAAPSKVPSSSSPRLHPLVVDLPSGALPPTAHVRQLCWLSGSQLLLLAAGPAGPAAAADPTGERLLQLQLRWPDQPAEEDGLAGGAGCKVELRGVTQLAGGVRVLQLVQGGNGSALVQLSNGEVRTFRPASPGGQPGQLVACAPSASFKEPCTRMAAAPTLPTHTHQASPPAFGLSAGGSLYWGSSLVASEVTSFTVRAGGAGGPALLYCTRRNLLYTVHLSQLMAGVYTHRELTEEATGKGNKHQHIVEKDAMRAAMVQAMRPSASHAAARDTLVRAVEQGAALLAAPRDGVVVVMQMPRGNLEAVSPRGLVLAAVAEALTHKQYAAAWDLACLNRVDLNLLVDWSWPSFLHSAPEFVADVPSASDLCDLLFALRQDSVCGEEGLYANIPTTPAVPKQTNTSQQGGAWRAENWDRSGTGGGGGGGDSDGEEEEGGATQPQNGRSDDDEDGDVLPPPGAAGGNQGPGQGNTDESGRLSGEEVSALVSAGQKVNAVCVAVRRAVNARLRLAGGGGKVTSDARQLVGADGVAQALPSSTAAAAATELLSVVVTSHARCDPPELGDALLAIKAAKEADLATSPGRGVIGGGGGGTGEGPAERALRALLLHVDAEVAYKHALGLYDLPLAFMVINHAQRDPGEYLLELQRFASIKDACLRRHALDMHLGRWEAALRHLVEAGPHTWDQALTLARDKGLLRQLLALVDSQQQQQGGATTAPAPTSTPAPATSPAAPTATAATPTAPPLSHSSRRQAVLLALGDALSTANKHEDAGLAYVAAGALNEALRAYRSGGQWRQVMVVAGRLGYDAPATTRLAADLVEELTSGAQPVAAATVLIQYLGDVDNGVLMLAKAREWREAMRVAYQHVRPDLVPTVVAPAAADAAASLFSDAREARERMSKYLERVRVVRNKREALSAAVRAAADAEGGQGPGADELADAQSDTAASSALTGMSLYTENTHALTGTQGSGSSRAPSTQGGRKAHKQEQRRAAKARKGRVRQGSPDEEASLVSHLLELGPQETTLTEAGTLAELLVMLGHEGDARTLQAALSGWLAEHQAVREELLKHPLAEDSIPRAFNNITQFYQQQQQQQQQQPGTVRAIAAAGSTMVGWKWDLLRPATG